MLTEQEKEQDKEFEEYDRSYGFDVALVFARRYLSECRTFEEAEKLSEIMFKEKDTLLCTCCLIDSKDRAVRKVISKYLPSDSVK